MGARLIFLDIDGTIVPSSSGGYLSALMGHQAFVDAAERAYAAGECTNDDVCDVDARGWAGFEEGLVSQWLDDMPVVAGLDELGQWGRDRGVALVLASLAWKPVSESLHRRFGFLVSGGPELVIEAGRYTGDVAAYFDEFDKRDAALSWAATHGISAADCIAVGDSRSDLPLFAAVGASIAFNASADARDAASLAVDADSIEAVIEVIESLSGAMR